MTETKHLYLVDEIPNIADLKATEKPYVYATNDGDVQFHWKPGKYFECAGLKWMRTNLGAKKETDYGLYYPWGGTIGYEDASVCTFSYTDPLSNMTYKKSFDDLKGMGAIDDDGILTPKYDAVTQALGDDYRIATNDEFQSLLDNTNTTWETNFNGSGVNGRKLTLKDGSDYLFFPASGFGFMGNVGNDVNYGYLWNSSVAPSGMYHARDFAFSIGRATTDVNYRYYGFPVRGVKTM